MRLTCRPIASSPSAAHSRPPPTQAYQWFLSSFYSQLTAGVDIIARGNIMFLVQSNVSHMRGGSADILMYLNNRIPQPLVLMAQGVTFLYCSVVVPIALASQLRWYAAPGVALLSFFFYGLVAAATAMQDPFHGRLCSFDTSAFLKTTQTACDDLLTFRADIACTDGSFAKMPEPAERWDDNAHWQHVSFSAPPTPRVMASSNHLTRVISNAKLSEVVEGKKAN
jgi:hypothetical protein